MESHGWLIASAWMTFALVASLISIRSYQRHYDQTPNTILVTAIIGSAVIPTLITQRFFSLSEPSPEPVSVRTDKSD